jgi:hypothetical protein
MVALEFGMATRKSSKTRRNPRTPLPPKLGLEDPKAPYMAKGPRRPTPSDLYRGSARSIQQHQHGPGSEYITQRTMLHGDDRSQDTYSSSRFPLRGTEEPMRIELDEHGQPIYLDDVFVYEEERPERSPEGTFGRKHLTLFDDADRLYADLDALKVVVVDALNDAISKAADEVPVADWADSALESDLSDADFCHQIAQNICQTHDRVRELIELMPPDDGLRPIEDRSNWTIEDGVSHGGDWSTIESEHPIELDADDVRCDWDGVWKFQRKHHNGTVTYATRAVDLYEVDKIVKLICLELEGDEDAADKESKKWWKEAVKTCDYTVKIDTNYFTSTLGDPSREEYLIFKTTVELDAYATINRDAVENELEQIYADEYDHEEEGADEPSPVIAPKLSAKSEKLPYALSNGWEVWNLSPDDMKAEGKAQKHCLGDAGMGYARAVEKGEIQIWAVKDPKDKEARSKFTLEVGVISDGTVYCFKQVKGVGNRLPGWNMKRDYDPYGGSMAFVPRGAVTNKDGTVLPPLKAGDVREAEVLALWSLLTQVPVAINHLPPTTLHALDLLASAESGSGTNWTQAQPMGTRLPWEYIDAAFEAGTTDARAHIRTANENRAVIVMEHIAKDMVPGLVAVFFHKLYNEDKRPTVVGGAAPIANPRPRRLSFDAPYVDTTPRTGRNPRGRR